MFEGLELRELKGRKRRESLAVSSLGLPIFVGNFFKVLLLPRLAERAHNVLRAGSP